MMVAPFNASTFPVKFHMGTYPAKFSARVVTVAFVLPCEPSDQFPGFFEVFKSPSAASAWLRDWKKEFDGCGCDRSEFNGNYS